MSRPVHDSHTRVTVTIPKWVAALRDRGVRAMLVLLAVALGGFVVMALGWRGAAATPYVPFQVPWLVSGGLLGLAVVGSALVAWSIHLERRANALHRHEVDELVRDVTALAEELRNGTRRFPARGRLPGDLTQQRRRRRTT